MGTLLASERRLLSTTRLLDIVLVLGAAGVDPRTFSAHDLARLDATLLRGLRAGEPGADAARGYYGDA